MLTVSSPFLHLPALDWSFNALVLLLPTLNLSYQAFLLFPVWSRFAPLCLGPVWLYPVLGLHYPGTALSLYGPAGPALTLVLSPALP